MNIIKAMSLKARVISGISAIALVSVIIGAVFILSDDALQDESGILPDEPSGLSEAPEDSGTAPQPPVNPEQDVTPGLNTPEHGTTFGQDTPLGADEISSETVITYELAVIPGLEVTPETAAIPAPDVISEPTVAPERPVETATAQTSVKAGDIIEFGGYDWQVLEVRDGRALIITEKLPENRAYHGEWMDVTWETCDLRAYLNGEFFRSFSAGDRARIAETRVINNNNPWYGTAGGSSTTDRIFLLSIEEVLRYFGDSGGLADRPAENDWFISDEHNGNRIARHINDDFNWDNDHGNWWWLRSPGESANRAAFVFDDGILYIDGHYARTRFLSVRPALWLDL
jgi:hypothetical protein